MLQVISLQPQGCCLNDLGVPDAWSATSEPPQSARELWEAYQLQKVSCASIHACMLWLSKPLMGLAAWLLLRPQVAFLDLQRMQLDPDSDLAGAGPASCLAGRLQLVQGQMGAASQVGGMLQHEEDADGSHCEALHTAKTDLFGCRRSCSGCPWRCASR